MNRGPDAVHPSPFALEQLLAGQASAEVTSHLLVCEACREQLSEMERAAKTFSASPRSLRAKDAAARADQRWRQRATMLALVPLALIALISLSTIKPALPDQQLAVKAPVGKLRQGREVLEPRREPWRTNLRSLPLLGHNVEFGQGSLEASVNAGPARPFTLEHTRVDIEITGFMQAVTVTQTFSNPFKAPVEALYVFPLPDDSAVHDMTMTAGNRIIRANIQKRAQARLTYEKARAEGRRAALLDQERPNIFTQSIANLLPGEKVMVTLQYVAPLRYDDGIYTLNFPMVVGPRYLPGTILPGESQGAGTKLDTDVVPDGSRISPPEARSGRDIEVAVRLNAGTVIEDLWSVSHRLEVDRPSSSQLSLALNPMDTLPNKDLIVRWRVSGTQARAAVLAAGGAFALMLNPESKEMNAPVTPKEMVFVIDTSCSMNGAPLAAAKRAMTQALQQLNADDTFMLIDFADTASSFHDAPLSATPNDVRRAIAYLQALPSGGGTNQLSGIRRALARPEDRKRLRMVLLMTDGFIGNEEEILAETRKLRGNARVFGFGIGSSVNHFLLSRLSEEGRGFYQYIRPDEDAAESVNRFTRRVARPLITDITIDWGGLQVADLTPAQAPDLFDVQPLIINGRYRTAGSGTVVLRGMRAGFPVVFETMVTLPELSTNGRALQMAWARRRIEALGAVQYNIAQPEVVEQITALGLEFHLVTKYTSLVAVEDVAVTNVPAVTVAEPTLTADQTTPSVGRFETVTVITGKVDYKNLSNITVIDGEALGFDGSINGQGTFKADEGGGANGTGELNYFHGASGSAFGTGGLGLRGTGAGGGGLGTLGSGKRGDANRVIVSTPVTTTPDTGTDRGEGWLGGKGGYQTVLGGDVTVERPPPVAKPADPAKPEPPAPAMDPKPALVPVAVMPTPTLPLMLATVDKPARPASVDEKKKPSVDATDFLQVARDPEPTNPPKVGQNDRPGPNAAAGEDDFNSAFGAPRRDRDPSQFPVAPPVSKTPGYIPPAPGAASEVKESLGQSDIMEVVLGHKAALGACVERQHRLAPGTSGKLVMKWFIERDGSTSRVSVVSEEFRNTPIATCVSELIKRMKFPPHQKQGDSITFPFKF